MTTTTNEIYLTKKLRLITSPKGKGKNARLVATIQKNFEALGYRFTRELFDRLVTLSEIQLADLYAETLPVLKRMRGAHRAFDPMYPNFPQQVMDMSDFELYLNAIIHYWTLLLPDTEKTERLPLTETVKYDLIDLGNEDGFKAIFTDLLAANTSINDPDKKAIEWFVSTYKDKIFTDLTIPERIPQKEQLALLVGLVLEHAPQSASKLSKLVKTPTDVLRIATAMSGGDVSLAENTKFRRFRRPERRLLIGLIESCTTFLSADMVKNRDRWIKLGHGLHVGEFAKQFPRAFEAFSDMRCGVHVETFNSKVEANLLDRDLDEAVKLLATRPGDFARRLDHLLRLAPAKSKSLGQKFAKVAAEVSTPVLLQAYNHFQTRNQRTNRTVFPKGSTAKMQVIPVSGDKVSDEACKNVAETIRNVLIERFGQKEKLGKVYIDPALQNFLAPFSQRSASKALRTIVRGSKLDLENKLGTIRFFVWWKDGEGRTDLDLSAVALNDDWSHNEDIAYYNLRSENGYGFHSGDITSAPNGACELIDINTKMARDKGVRYIAMVVTSYTSQPFCDLPECFAGWMGRQKPNSGEVFEAKTVKNKIDIAANTRCVIPLVIDLVEHKVIWCDLGLKNNPRFVNAVGANKRSISTVCQAMSELRKTNLHELFTMHALGRGKLVNDPEKADTIFSVDKGITPFDEDKIVAEFLA